MNISFEIFEEINDMGIETVDLCRVVGILLDNAIEAYRAALEHISSTNVPAAIFEDDVVLATSRREVQAWLDEMSITSIPASHAVLLLHFLSPRAGAVASEARGSGAMRTRLGRDWHEWTTRNTGHSSQRTADARPYSSRV